MKKIITGRNIAFIALIVSILSFWRDCGQDKEIDKINFLSNAVQHQPTLVSVSKLDITNVWLEPVSVKVPLDTHDSTEPVGIPLETNILIKTNIKLTNVGNSNAKIIAVMMSDSLTANPFIRNAMLDPERKMTTVQSMLPPFLKSELLPNNSDTTQIELTYKIHNVRDNLFTLHYLILYENDLGNIYDTYYWNQYRIHFVFHPPFVLEDGKPKISISKEKVSVDLEDLMRLQYEKSSYNTYDMSETDYLNKYLDKTYRQFQGDQGIDEAF
jgi:hypothetical protein